MFDCFKMWFRKRKVSIDNPNAVRAHFRWMRWNAASIIAVNSVLVILQVTVLLDYPEDFFHALILIANGGILIGVSLLLMWGLKFICQPWFEVAVIWKGVAEDWQRAYHAKEIENDELRTALAKAQVPS